MRAPVGGSRQARWLGEIRVPALLVRRTNEVHSIGVSAKSPTTGLPKNRSYGSRETGGPREEASRVTQRESQRGPQ